MYNQNDHTRIVQANYPYNKGYFHNDMGYKIVNLLFDNLPHGSGIDYSWFVKQGIKKPNRFYCQNSYHTMDENGMYDRIYDFTVVIDYAMGFEFIRLNFNGINPEKYRSGYGLREYLESEFYYIFSENNG